MTETKRVAVFGMKPPTAYQSRFEERRLALHKKKLVRPNTSTMFPQFVYYDDSDEEENSKMPPSWLNSSYNMVDYVRSREYGIRQERLSINKHNFTKKLMVYNVKSREMVQIPPVVGRVNDVVNPNWGVYTIKINPSRTLLATNAHNSKEIAVYKMPSLNPIYLTENAHTNWVNDIDWLDDESFVSGSSDSNLALWHVPNKCDDELFNNDDIFIRAKVDFVNPKSIQACKAAKDIHSVIYNKDFKEILTLSTNGYAHIWDIEYLRQRYSKKLSTNRNAMCVSMKNNSNLFAIGCRSNTLLHDSRTLNVIKKIPSRYNGCAIKSLSFEDNVITIGTGVGIVMFYDMRAGRYLESKVHKNKGVILKSGTGYLNVEDSRNPDFRMDNYSPTIYTHCYDYSGTRLFIGGGPLAPELYGNYAGLWE